MRIVNASEQAQLETPPIFSSAERKQYLNLPKSLMEMAESLHSSSARIGFLLMCGYFRAGKRFFMPADFRIRDIEYAAVQLGLAVDAFSAGDYAKATRFRHQQIILNFFGFRAFDQEAETLLETEITMMVRAHLKPRLIFGRCLDVLVQNKVQIPGTRRLTDIIRSQINLRKRQLAKLVETHLAPSTREKLDELFTTGESESRYRLTLLKKQSQSTKPTKIRESVADFQTICALYHEIAPVLEMLDLGLDGVRYYAGSVLRSEIFQIRRRSDADRHIHTLAFIAHQHHRLQDNLVDVLLSVVQTSQNTAQRAHKDKVYEERQTQSEELDNLLTAIETKVVGPLSRIRNLADDAMLSDAQKIERIKQVLAQGKEGEFSGLKAKVKSGGNDDDFFNTLESQSLYMQSRLSPVLKAVSLRGNANTSALMAAIEHFRAKDGVISKNAPLGFLNPSERKAVKGETATGWRTSLYKSLLFVAVASAIKAGNLNMTGSYKWRPLDDYLIDRERWNRDKTALLERANLLEFADPEPVLRELEVALHRQYEITNTNAREGRNLHLKIMANGKFRVATPALDPLDSDHLQSNFPNRHVVPLPEILATVNQHCVMIDAFQHWHQGSSRTIQPAVLFAGIMGLGCGIGIQKMARISSSITERELEHAVNWRFSIENIIAANDKVVEAMDQMALPNIYRKSPERLHTASDGQKFEVRAESLNANYSYKYFGNGQGVSAYTFIDERNLLWHSLVFSASERESAYVIDGLMHNDVIQSDIHSTDTHGYSEAIFATTYPLGVSFAPRIKNLKKQKLYQFRAGKKEGRPDWVIKPNNYVDEATIRANWDEFLRLLVTIKLKESTASDIFRRLNSYSRQHSLYKAMKAFGQIIKSIFILRYIDDLELRQAIEKVLNKVELANKFTRAVAVGNPREFAQAEKEEQEIAESCNRLIKNSIICWNYLYLAHKLNQTEDPETRQRLLEAIAAHSPQSWGHVNMLGEYDFSDEKLQDSLGILLPK